MNDRNMPEPAAPQPAATRVTWLILIAVGVGTFMSALDASVVNTVLPVIRQTFGADVATVEWVVTAYLLVVSGLLLSFGRLGDLRGHKRVYTAGFAVFIVSSVLCGLSPTPLALIASRALQAIGGAMLFANSPAIVTKNFPTHKRGQALGVTATMTYLGLTTGPPLGGFLTSAYSWRAVFYINVPIGIAALLLTWRFVPSDSGERQRERFDLLGAATFMLGLVLLLLALNQGHAWGWTSAAILGLLVVALAVLAAFVVIEKRVSSPMLDLTLFERPVFSAATASAVLNYIAVYSIVFLMPFYLIQGRGLSPAKAGALFVVQSVTMAIVAPLSGTLSDRIGSRLPAAVGMMTLAAGLLLLSRLGPNTPLAYVAAMLFVSGLGTGIFVSPNNSALMGAAPLGRQGIAAGILAEARNVGMVLGVGLSGAIFTSILGTRAIAGSQEALVAAIDTSFLVVAGAAVLGAVVSATCTGGSGSAEAGATVIGRR